MYDDDIRVSRHGSHTTIGPHLFFPFFLSLFVFNFFNIQPDHHLHYGGREVDPS